jgi:hypothetical protein
MGFTGEHAGVNATSSLSIIQTMSVGFSRGMPSATMDVLFNSEADPAVADTVLTLLNSVTYTDHGDLPVDFAFQPFSMAGNTPYAVQYGTQPGAPVRYFDTAHDFAAAGGPGTFVHPNW